MPFKKVIPFPFGAPCLGNFEINQKLSPSLSVQSPSLSVQQQHLDYANATLCVKANSVSNNKRL